MPDFGAYPEQKGSIQLSGDATTMIFSIPHGLGAIPKFAIAWPTSTDADSDFFTTKDGTNITITYSWPPPSGTNNLSFDWRVSL